MTPEEAVRFVESIRFRTEMSICPEREALSLAITALKLISTVDEGKFGNGNKYTMKPSEMYSKWSYMNGWNDALEAIKIRLMRGDDWSDMNE